MAQTIDPLPQGRDTQAPRDTEATQGYFAFAPPVATHDDRSPIDSELRFKLLVESVSGYAIYMLDPNGIVTNWNPGAERITGYRADEIVGRSFGCLFAVEDRLAGGPERIIAAAADKGRHEVQGWRVRKDGSRFWANIVIDTIRDPDGMLIGFAKVTRDITEHHESRERLFRLAHVDTLTDLPNRLALRAELERVIGLNRSVSLLMLDLDGFKEVNDTLGHAAGDHVLKAAADRIKEAVGCRGTVGRLGGDEFAVVLPDLSNPIGAAAVAQELVDTFRAPFSWEDQEPSLSLSIGISIGPLHGSSAEDLLTNADLALYKVKAAGRNGYCLFQPSMRQAVLAGRKCESELRQAIAVNELELYYQPQVSLDDGQIIGAEALLRWRHPQLGLLAPGAFLPVLERGPLALVVGEWAIRTACAQVAMVRKEGMASFRVAVNLFGAQFRNDQLVPIVKDALSQNGLAPDALELEITENIILRHDEAMIAPLRELRDLGVGISFDDYGTGYASLSLLKRFPLTRLKIDQSFVRDLCADAGDCAVVSAIIFLAQKFVLEAVAEGIETEEQALLLRRLGCTHGQGYLFGKPMPADALLQSLRQTGGASLARSA